MADYAISNVPRRVVYAASGVGPYAFTFEILNQTDIAVYKASTLLTLTTDYTVTINANGTGSVTLVATAGTSNITIVGAKNIQRTTDFTTGGDLFANTLNDELDNQTIFIQQVAETAERGLKAPVVDPTDINMTLPAKASRVGTVLAFNATTGNPEAGPSIGSVTTVAAQSANINTVATNIASVNTVAGNITNVNTVAGISSDVTMVATFQYNVNTVADDLNEPTSEINTVAVDIANVNAVGTNISNVNTVAGVSANVTTVAGISGNVTTVAGVAAGVTTVAGISANVTTVATNNANVTTVATNIANVNSVGTNIANVNSVAGNATNINAVNANATNINTVAGISGNVTTVATNNANVTTVAGSIASVNTNATNIANINQNAANIVAIQNASANATAAAGSATAAASSATSASASAAAASAVALGNEPVRHSVRPSLLLDFANTKQLDPRITYTRASTGTYYDGKTVAKAEENLLQQSQTFDNAYWSKARVTVTANSTTAPDGTTTAESLIENNENNTHTVGNSIVAVLGQFYTISFFAKANTRTICAITSFDTASSTAWFDLSAGTVGTVSGTITTSISNAGNGWYRCSITRVATASGTLFFNYYLTNADNVLTYTGDGTSSIFIWGAQLEQRSSVTAYTATTTAPITNYVPVLLSAPANVARFEHNPVTGESLGLEIEESRTNLLTYSEQFDNVAWTKTNATITANTIVAPDGTLTGEKLVETATTAAHSIYNSATATAASHTFSTYVKAGERSFVALEFNLNGGGYAWFNLTTGAVGTVGGGISASACIITSVGNGWYRCSITQALSAGTVRPSIYCASTNGATSYAGDGYSGVFIWGAQLEAGSFATSYIPTVASQVTRSPDAASMTGTNFSSWYNPAEGTLYADWATYNFATTFNILIQGTTGNSIQAVFNTNAMNISTEGVSQCGFSFSVPSAGAFSKQALAYKANDFAGARNGGTAQSDTSGSVPVVSQLTIQSTLSGYVKKLSYYPKRLTNAELQGLTTI